MTAKCIFCDRENIKGDILWESDNFYVKVGVGILAPGHVMVISKRHLSCFGEMPQEFDDEFLRLKEYVFGRVKSVFHEPIVYEQGVYGQSVNHAHIHFIPKKSDAYSLKWLDKELFMGLKYREASNIFEIKDVYKKDGSYIYLEDSGRKLIYLTKGLPDLKYTFRKEFARITGIKELSDWRTMPNEFKEKNEEWVNTTKEKLALKT